MQVSPRSRVIAAIVILLASAAFLSEVSANTTQTRRLCDSGEAAWVYNGAYLAPFLAQDRDHEC